jgi:hypothetical protein
MLKSLASATLVTLASALPLLSADQAPATTPAPVPVAIPAAAPALALEAEVIDGKSVPVTPKKELSFNVAADPDVKSRELWYRSNDGKSWGEWQKHGIQFDKDTPITWAAPEGHWQIYLRKILTSNLASPVPGAATKAHGEFIIDRTAPTVAIKFPGAKAKLKGGEHYAVTWDAQDAHLRNSPVTITYSRDGKGSWDTVATGIPNSGSFDWTVPRDMTTTGVLKIEAADKATNVGSAETTGILVDSIKPKGRVTGPAISAKTDLTLDLDIKDEGPAGLASAQVWISQDDGTSWTQGPFIQDPRSVAWKAPGDGKFRLAVVATDQAGNQSPIPKGKADDQFVLTVDTGAPVIMLTSAIGIIPADKAGPTSQRDFKPGDKVQVPFTVKDVNLAPNTISVFFQSDAAKGWTEIGKGLPVDQTFRFDVPAVETKEARIKVSAVDAAGNIGEGIATESFTIQTQVKDDAPEINLNP